MQGITIRDRFQGDRLSALADNFLIIIKYCICNGDISVISILPYFQNQDQPILPAIGLLPDYGN